MSVRVARAEPPWRYRALPGGSGGTYAGFGLVELAPGHAMALPAEAVGGASLETVVVPLRGRVDVDTAAHGAIHLEGRTDVWQGPTDVAYLPPPPPGGAHALRAAGASAGVAVAAIGWAPCAAGDPAAWSPLGVAPRVVRAVDVTLERRGEGATEREVRHLYEGDRPAARLLVVEVVTPAGHWSSFPPHRHDDPVLLEEFYYCEVAPANRAAYLHVFTDGDGPPGPPLDEAVAVRDGELVLVRRGYHTAATPPGTDLYYLNVMAGTRRSWTPYFHPAYRDLVVGWGGAPVDPARPRA